MVYTVGLVLIDNKSSHLIRKKINDFTNKSFIPFQFPIDLQILFSAHNQSAFPAIRL